MFSVSMVLEVCDTPAIIASGPNAWYGHYFQNNSLLTDGDLILMDMRPITLNIRVILAECGPSTVLLLPISDSFTVSSLNITKPIEENCPGEMATAIMDQTAIEMKA